MSQAILKMFCDRRVAFIGEYSEVNRIAKICQKWDDTYLVVQELFDDGLNFYNHCMSLYIQNDGRAWRAMEDLFRRTKEQGKTAKTVWKKEAYFRKGFWKIIHDNPQLAEDEKAEARKSHDIDNFQVDSALCNWWMQYYFDEFDPALKVKIKLYNICEDYAEIVTNALAMERRMKGNRTEPKLTLPCSETELKVHARDECFLRFEWDNLSNAYEMMERLKQWGWQSNSGKYWDHTTPVRKRLKRMFPNARIECMNTRESMNGDANNWFYIYFNWKPKDFSWAQVRKAERAVKELVFPHIKQFRPAAVPKKYQVVTLTMA